MISGILAGWLLLNVTQAADSPDLDALLAGLAAADTSELAFREKRTSELLEQPLVVSGTLHHDGDGRLVRRTTEPSTETQILSERHIEIRKPDGFRNRFSLRRAPELAVLRSALLALLNGDRDALEKEFRLALETTEDRPGQWQLRLEPRQQSEDMPVEHLLIHGCRDRIDRFVLRLTDGETIDTEIEPVP
jgi:hypothetical protein